MHPENRCCVEKNEYFISRSGTFAKISKEGFQLQGGAARTWESSFSAGYLVYPIVFIVREGGSLHGVKMFHCWSLCRFEDVLQSALLLTMAHSRLPVRMLVTFCSSLFSPSDFMFLSSIGCLHVFDDRVPWYKLYIQISTTFIHLSRKLLFGGCCWIFLPCKAHWHIILGASQSHSQLCSSVS